MKLVLIEPETSALEAALPGWDRQLASVVAEVEVARAAARVGADASRVRAVLERPVLIECDASIRAIAARLSPPSLRALDAIHVASALSIAAPHLVFVSYDERCLSAAAAAGLEVVSPGR